MKKHPFTCEDTDVDDSADNALYVDTTDRSCDVSEWKDVDELAYDPTQE